MPNAAALRALYRTMPDRQSVVFRKKTAPGTYTDIPVDDAWRRPTEVAEGAPSGGVYTRAYQDWHFPQTMLGETEPEPGDIVRGADPRTDVGRDWIVLSVGEVGALGAWRLPCVSLALRDGLTDTGQLLRPDNTPDGEGKRVPNLTLFETLTCRLQLLTGDDDATFAAQGERHTATAYVAERIIPRTGDVLEVDSARWTVIGFAGFDTLDNLGELHLEDLPT